MAGACEVRRSAIEVAHLQFGYIWDLWIDLYGDLWTVGPSLERRK